MPGEGLFIGEPLASPWGTDEVDFDSATATLTIATFGLTPNLSYTLSAADDVDGPFERVRDILISRHDKTTITIENAVRRVYRLQATN